MNKQGFIDGLRGNLSGRVSPRLVEEHANYYEDYINMQIRLGKSEAEVLEGLGDPRWIAKTIISANGGEDGQSTGNSYENSGRYSSSGYYGSGNGDYVTPSDGGVLERVKAWFEKWGPKLVRLAFILLVLGGVVSLVFSIVGFLIPFAIPILFMVFIVKLFKDWLN